MGEKPSYLNFDKKGYPWKPGTDYRKHPELYRVGKGEQGVLICEPYKSEIGKHWRFKTAPVAIGSSEKIYRLFTDYLALWGIVLQRGRPQTEKHGNSAIDISRPFTIHRH